MSTGGGISVPGNNLDREAVLIRPTGNADVTLAVEGWQQVVRNGATGAQTVTLFAKNGSTDLTATHEVAPKIVTRSLTKEVANSTFDNAAFLTLKPNAEIESFTVVATADAVTVTANGGDTASCVVGQSKTYAGLSGDTGWSIVANATGAADVEVTYREYA